MKNFVHRVWSGDSKAIEEYRKMYNEPKKDILPWIILLYSSHYKKQYKDELIQLAPTVLAKARKGHGRFQERDNDYALSTVLIWFSKNVQPELRDSYLYEARKICSAGIGVLHHQIDNLEVDHTSLLLYLTQIELDILQNTKKGDELGRTLERCVSLADMVRNPNQKAKILRKAGILLRRVGHRTQSIKPSLRSCFMFGIGLSTRIKSLFALVQH